MTQPSTVIKSRGWRGRTLRAMFLAVLLAGAAGVWNATPVAAWDSNSYSVEDEQLLFSLTNQARSSAGLPVLRNDSYLVGLARWRSKDMIVRKYFSHNIPPSGELVFSQMQRDGYCFAVAGENIGVSTFDDAVATTRIQNAFMNSPGHRANILGKTWTNMGVGTYKGADGKKIWTVLFSQKCGSTPTPKPTPKPTAKPTPKPTPRPTARSTTPATPRPTSAPARTPAPTAAPTTAPTAAPTATPAAEPTSTLEPAPTATAATNVPTPSAPVAGSPNLRVRQPVRSDSWWDSVFRTLFGGIFG